MRQISRATLVLLTATLLTACGGPEPASPQPQTYTVRGRILTMPASPGGEIQIEHEAIHDFVDYRGEVVGMDAMTMSFALAEGVGEGGSDGDIVEFDLLVDWDAEPLATVTALRVLPEDTQLVFGRAEPPTE